MILPYGVTVNPASPPKFISQRGWWDDIWGFKSCMFASLCQVLDHAGLDIPADLVFRLHLASGAALGKGTSMVHSQVALRRLMPEAPVMFGWMLPDELLDALRQGAAIRIIVSAPLLPDRLKPWMRTYKGQHAVTLRGINDVGQVYWIDPMGKPVADYVGRWARWLDILPAIPRNAKGQLAVTLAFKDAAVEVSQRRDPAIVQLESALQIAKAAVEEHKVVATEAVASRDRLLLACVEFTTKLDGWVGSLVAKIGEEKP
jgi:hypothetical protein